MSLIIGALLGFSSVAFAAYAEHGLQRHVSPAAFHSLMTAIHYQQLHALMLVSIGLALGTQPAAIGKILRYAAFAFILGIACFCFSIYAAVILALPELSRFAPFGGSTLMLGWMTLAYAGWKMRRARKSLPDAAADPK